MTLQYMLWLLFTLCTVRRFLLMQETKSRQRFFFFCRSSIGSKCENMPTTFALIPVQTHEIYSRPPHNSINKNELLQQRTRKKMVQLNQNTFINRTQSDEQNNKRTNLISGLFGIIFLPLSLNPIQNASM